MSELRDTTASPLKPIKNERGMALVLAIFSVVLITHIVMEISYETNIEYLVNAKSVQRVKAYYAAKSGVEISLLRIKIYNGIMQTYGENLKSMGAMAKMVDMVWSMPFMWPPMLPPDVDTVSKEQIEAKVKESVMDATYQTSIMDEGTKIDVNDLDSPAKTIRESTKKLLLQIFESKKQQDEEWAKLYQSTNFEEVINNMIDWLDTDREAKNGGAENQGYQDLRDLQDLGIQYPPNRHFRSVDEIRLVTGMTEDIFQILLPRVTVFGAKAINPNYAPADLIKSLDPSITDEVMAEFLKRRSDPEQGPFTQKNEFWSFLDSHGARIAKETIDETPLAFTKPTNFRIKAIGEYKGAVRQIEAIVFDVDNSVATVSGQYKKDAQAASGGGSAGGATGGTSGQGNPSGNRNQTPSKGPPRIVYWTEN